MGIIKTAVNALGGTLADQWLETIEPFEMGDNTVMTCGVSVRRMTAATATGREARISLPMVL